MGVLEAFMSTWSKARDTFGKGVQLTGEHFDQSGPPRQMQTTVESAAPGSRWSGTAANAYGTANADHGKVFGDLAALDQRLGQQVTRFRNRPCSNEPHTREAELGTSRRSIRPRLGDQRTTGGELVQQGDLAGIRKQPGQSIAIRASGLCSVGGVT